MTPEPASGATLASLLFVLLAIFSAALFFAITAIRRLRHERDELIHQKDVIFGFIHDVGDVFAHSENIDLERMLDRVLFYAVRTTKASAGAIYLFDKSEGLFRARSVSGIFPPLTGSVESAVSTAVSKSQAVEQLVRSQRVARGEGLIGETADFGTPILIEDAARDPRVPTYQLDFLKIHSILLVPMRFLQKILGVIVVVNRVDARPFIQADLSLLQALADQASVSVHYAGLRDSLNEKQRIDHDLNVARQIQTALLPRAIPRLPGLEMAAFTHSAQEIGGDYYDFIHIDDDHIGIAIADVSGKGIVGAIMMSISRSVLRAQATMSTDPTEVLKGVNRIMFEDIAEDMFVSMLYMVLNTQTLELRVARAGHERPILVQSHDKHCQIIDSAGVALGMADRDGFDTLLTETSIVLSPGDTLVAYTDGVTEALNGQGDEWGADQLFETIHQAAPNGAHAVINTVQHQLERFVGGIAQYDDMTLLALQVAHDYKSTL